jgi:hypothetical protein
MQSPSASICEALSDEEVCPLCLDRYTAADECMCVVCRAPSCPGCAENIDADGAMRCFACRPAQLGVKPAALAARESISLPHPIRLSACTPELAARVPGEPPPLPFPLTTSPRGVRNLQPRPAGSVFVGLPSVPPQLAQTLRATPPVAGVDPGAGARALRLIQLRAQLSRLRRSAAGALVRAQLSRLQRSAAGALASWSARSGQAWRERLLPLLQTRLVPLLQTGRVRLAQLSQATLVQLRLAGARTLALRPRVRQLAGASLVRLKQLRRLTKPLSAELSARLRRARSLSPGPSASTQPDRSSSISL